MLIQFRFKNFRSYRGEALLDMRVVDDFSRRFHSVDSGFEKILPVASIYGSNASGKSNFIEAFKFMINTVLKGMNLNEVSHCAFALDVESKNVPSEFEVFFSQDDKNGSKVYNYGFVIGVSGILEEWLNLRTSAEGSFVSIFYREMNVIDDDHLLAVDTSDINERLNSSVLLLSLYEELELGILRSVYEWFEGNTVLTEIPVSVPYDSDDNTVKYLKACGLHIEGIVDKDEIRLLHKVNGSDELVAMPLEMESAGTKKLISLYGYLSYAIRHGSLLFIDDLDVHLHPSVVRLIVNAFMNLEMNPYHAQLIFTAYDSWQLASDSLRRDEIWFVDRNGDCVSELYALSEFKIGAFNGRDSNLQNDYMLGKFGAIPDIGSLAMLE